MIHFKIQVDLLNILLSLVEAGELLCTLSLSD